MEHTKHLRIFIALFSVLFLAYSSNAQQKYFAETLDNSNGLSNSCITSIFQDSDKLLWIGTWDGLNVYDGTSFHVFNYRPGESSINIGNNIITQIKEDARKNIWINTMDGISRYNKQSGKFRHYFYDEHETKNYIKRKSIISTDNQGNIYCISKTTSFLYKYNAIQDKFIMVDLGDKQPLQNNGLLFDEQNRLWIIDNKGVLKGFKRSNNKFCLFKSISDPYGVNDFFFVNHKLFYTNNNKQLIIVDHEFKIRTLNMPNNIKEITFYNNHYIISWSLKGIGEYNTDFRTVNDITKQLALINAPRFTAMISGNENIFWLGTDGNGIIKLGRKDNRIGTVNNLTGARSGSAIVRSFFELNDELWVGTRGSGLIAIKNLGQSNQTLTKIKFQSPTGKIDTPVYTIKKGIDGYVYIGSDGPGITLYDLKQKKSINYSAITNTDKYTKFRFVHTILPQADSSVWLGTEIYGLIHLKLSTSANGDVAIKYLDKYIYENSHSGLGSDIVYALEQGNDDQIYVGCRFGGLTVYNKKTKSFKTFRAFSYDGSLSNNDVLSLCLDKKNRLWIGTSYGLNWINEVDLAKPEPVFHQLNTENGMPNNTIHGITEDDQGNIWASTNKGLACIEKQGLKIKQFKTSDGLLSDEFSDGAIFRSVNNKLFFGGASGFNYFKPDQLTHNPIRPNLLLSKSQPSGKHSESYRITVIPANGNFISLKYNLSRQDNFIELHLKAIKFHKSDKCRVTYFLEGYDKDWQYLSEDSKIAYGNLPPGTYKLKIKWTNGDGVWSNEVTVADVEIKQYFWLTYPAIFFYVMLFVISSLVFYRNRRNKLIMMHKLSIEHVMREKDEQQHQEHLRFFTNVAHELQTPLTLITGSIDRYSSKNKKLKINENQGYFLDIIKLQASRLSYLVYQLLEFRKAESGHLQLNNKFINVSNLMDNIVKLFTPVKEQKKLELSCHFNTDIIIWADKDKLEKIIFNLLSNAFKHTIDNQNVICSLNTTCDGQNVELIVANSGCMLSQNEIDRLFTLFFVADASQQSKISSGIGLAFTRELVTLMQGNITVKCENNWISFKVILPVNIDVENNDKKEVINDGSDVPSFLITAITDKHFAKPALVINNQEALFNELADRQRKSILIIEDEPDIRYLLKDILNEHYIVYEADSGRHAIEVLEKVSPNLIISDIMMPDMTGLEVCEMVKNTPSTCHIPFIILSARGSAEHKAEGYEVGAEAYIPKPFNAEYLLMRIRKLLDYQQKLRDLFSQDISTLHLLETGLNHEDKDFLKQVIKFIEDNLDSEALNAESIRKQVGVSLANLYRRLKTLSGMTPGELILNTRIKYTAHLLKSSELTVSEIFYKAGFSNRSYFFREFKKKYSTSPAEYRIAYRLIVDIQ